MSYSLKLALQGAARRAGYQIRRLDRDVSLVDPYEEQLRLIPNARSIFEVGAADGRDCERYRELFPGAIVHAFEPLPENYEKLAARAGVDPSLKAHQMALSGVAGSASFHVGALADASSLLSPRKTGSTFDRHQASVAEITVKTDTLESVAAAAGVDAIDILKMDAQGAELSILRGGRKLLETQAIRVIYTEVQFRPLYEGAGTFAEIASYLAGYGYSIHNLYGIIHNQLGEACWCDVIFLPDRHNVGI